jgi:hypothetical protein
MIRSVDFGDATHRCVVGDVSTIVALKADPLSDGISLREAITAANATAGHPQGLTPALSPLA